MNSVNLQRPRRVWGRVVFAPTLQYKVLDSSSPICYKSAMFSAGPVHARRRCVTPAPTRAIEDLRFIRRTMENAVSFTAVPGWGGVGMGVTALATAAMAPPPARVRAWLITWLAGALLAIALGALGIYWKAGRAGTPVLTQPGRKFLLSFLPPVVAAGMISVMLSGAGLARMLPGVWLLLYGVAVISAGTFSVKVVPVMGVCFMLVGVAALFSPAAWGNGVMAVGFGGLHLLFGMIIARRYGG